MKLVYDNNGKEVKVGDKVNDMTVEYFRKPHKSSSEGHVSVSEQYVDGQREYYVSVIGATWIEREDR